MIHSVACEWTRKSSTTRADETMRRVSTRKAKRRTWTFRGYKDEEEHNNGEEKDAYQWNNHGGQEVENEQGESEDVKGR